MAEMYYGFWATLSQYSIWQRAAVIIGIVIFILYLFSPYWKYIFIVLLKLVQFIWDYVLYFGAQEILYIKRAKLNFRKTAREMNDISAFFESKEKELSRIITRCKKSRKRIRFRYFIALYCLIILLISLPNFIGNVVDKEYIYELSVVEKFYSSLEAGALAEAQKYRPFFKLKNREKRQEEQHAEENNPIWLSLSGEGVSGANIRSGPGKENKSIKVVQGGEQLLLLERGDGWVRVRTEDGTEGWISMKIVTGY